MFRNLPDSPPPSIPNCPVCGQPMEYSYVTLAWQCFDPDCPNDAVFSLAAYEASERAKARRLDELDNAVEVDDDEPEDEDWFDEW